MSDSGDDGGARWLIGQAGYRLASDARNRTGQALLNE